MNWLLREMTNQVCFFSYQCFFVQLEGLFFVDFKKYIVLLFARNYRVTFTLCLSRIIIMWCAEYIYIYRSWIRYKVPKITCLQIYIDVSRYYVIRTPWHLCFLSDHVIQYLVSAVIFMLPVNTRRTYMETVQFFKHIWIKLCSNTEIHHCWDFLHSL